MFILYATSKVKELEFIEREIEKDTNFDTNEEIDLDEQEAKKPVKK